MAAPLSDVRPPRPAKLADRPSSLRPRRIRSGGASPLAGADKLGRSFSSPMGTFIAQDGRHGRDGHMTRGGRGRRYDELDSDSSSAESVSMTRPIHETTKDTEIKETVTGAIDTKVPEVADKVPPAEVVKTVDVVSSVPSAVVVTATNTPLKRVGSVRERRASPRASSRAFRGRRHRDIDSLSSSSCDADEGANYSAVTPITASPGGAAVNPEASSSTMHNQLDASDGAVVRDTDEDGPCGAPAVDVDVLQPEDDISEPEASDVDASRPDTAEQESSYVTVAWQEDSGDEGDENDEEESAVSEECSVEDDVSSATDGQEVKITQDIKSRDEDPSKGTGTSEVDQDATGAGRSTASVDVILRGAPVDEDDDGVRVPASNEVGSPLRGSAIDLSNHVISDVHGLTNEGNGRSTNYASRMQVMPLGVRKGDSFGPDGVQQNVPRSASAGDIGARLDVTSSSKNNTSRWSHLSSFRVDRKLSVALSLSKRRQTSGEHPLHDRTDEAAGWHSGTKYEVGTSKKTPLRLSKGVPLDHYVDTCADSVADCEVRDSFEEAMTDDGATMESIHQLLSELLFRSVRPYMLSNDDDETEGSGTGSDEMGKGDDDDERTYECNGQNLPYVQFFFGPDIFVYEEEVLSVVEYVIGLRNPLHIPLAEHFQRLLRDVLVIRAMEARLSAEIEGLVVERVRVRPFVLSALFAITLNGAEAGLHFVLRFVPCLLWGTFVNPTIERLSHRISKEDPPIDGAAEEEEPQDLGPSKAIANTRTLSDSDFAGFLDETLMRVAPKVVRKGRAKGTARPTSASSEPKYAWASSKSATAQRKRLTEPSSSGLPRVRSCPRRGRMDALETAKRLLVVLDTRLRLTFGCDDGSMDEVAAQAARRAIPSAWLTGVQRSLAELGLDTAHGMFTTVGDDAKSVGGALWNADAGLVHAEVPDPQAQCNSDITPSTRSNKRAQWRSGAGGQRTSSGSNGGRGKRASGKSTPTSMSDVSTTSINSEAFARAEKMRNTGMIRDRNHSRDVAVVKDVPRVELVRGVSAGVMQAQRLAEAHLTVIGKASHEVDAIKGALGQYCGSNDRGKRHATVNEACLRSRQGQKVTAPMSSIFAGIDAMYTKADAEVSRGGVPPLFQWSSDDFVAVARPVHMLPTSCEEVDHLSAHDRSPIAQPKLRTALMHRRHLNGLGEGERPAEWASSPSVSRCPPAHGNVGPSFGTEGRADSMDCRPIGVEALYGRRRDIAQTRDRAVGPAHNLGNAAKGVVSGTDADVPVAPHAFVEAVVRVVKWLSSRAHGYDPFMAAEMGSILVFLSQLGETPFLTSDTISVDTVLSPFLGVVVSTALLPCFSRWPCGTGKEVEAGTCAVRIHNRWFVQTVAYSATVCFPFFAASRQNVVSALEKSHLARWCLPVTSSLLEAVTDCVMKLMFRVSMPAVSSIGLDLVPVWMKEALYRCPNGATGMEREAEMAFPLTNECEPPICMKYDATGIDATTSSRRYYRMVERRMRQRLAKKWTKVTRHYFVSDFVDLRNVDYLAASSLTLLRMNEQVGKSSYLLIDPQQRRDVGRLHVSTRMDGFIFFHPRSAFSSQLTAYHALGCYAMPGDPHTDFAHEHRQHAYCNPETGVVRDDEGAVTGTLARYSPANQPFSHGLNPLGALYCGRVSERPAVTSTNVGGAGVHGAEEEVAAQRGRKSISNPSFPVASPTVLPVPSTSLRLCAALPLVALLFLGRNAATKGVPHLGVVASAALQRAFLRSSDSAELLEAEAIRAQSLTDTL